MPPRAARSGFIFEKQVNVMSEEILKSVEASVNPNVPQVRTGDSVDVHVRITEGNRQRIQIFRGTVIRVRGGGMNANYTVRRVASNGIGVERTFLARSPHVEKVIVNRHSHVSRSRLYFLRDRTGKNARLKQKFDN
jgi:large subunit ribosomal protein L19